MRIARVVPLAGWLAPTMGCALAAALATPVSAQNLHQKYGPGWDCRNLSIAPIDEGFATDKEETRRWNAGTPQQMWHRWEVCRDCEKKGMDFFRSGTFTGYCVPRATASRGGGGGAYAPSARVATPGSKMAAAFGLASSVMGLISSIYQDSQDNSDGAEREEEQRREAEWAWRQQIDQKEGGELASYSRKEAAERERRRIQEGLAALQRADEKNRETAAAQFIAELEITSARLESMRQRSLDLGSGQQVARANPFASSATVPPSGTAVAPQLRQAAIALDKLVSSRLRDVLNADFKKGNALANEATELSMAAQGLTESKVPLDQQLRSVARKLDDLVSLQGAERSWVRQLAGREQAPPAPGSLGMVRSDPKNRRIATSNSSIVFDRADRDCRRLNPSEWWEEDVYFYPEEEIPKLKLNEEWNRGRIVKRVANCRG